MGSLIDKFKEGFTRKEANGFNRKHRRALKALFNFSTNASNKPYVKES